MSEIIQLNDIQKIYDEIFLELSKNIVNAAYDSLSSVISALRINVLQILSLRYEGKNVDPCYIDVFRISKVLWVRKASRLISELKTYDNYVKVVPSLLSIYLVNEYITSNNLISRLRWYLYGILLSDGSVVARKSPDVIRIHTTDPALLGIALMFSPKCTIIQTMIRRYKRLHDRFRIYFLADMYELSEIVEMYHNEEEPSSEDEYAQFLAGLIDGDGNVEPQYSKVRISMRANPRSSSTKEKNSRTLRILLNGAIIDEKSLKNSTFLRHDYISIRLTNDRIIRILRKSLSYVLIPHKRRGLMILLKRRSINDTITNIIKEFIKNNCLEIKCRRKRTTKYVYKVAYVRSKNKDILLKLKDELIREFHIEVRGPYRVDNTRYEIVFPERLSRYICEE